MSDVFGAQDETRTHTVLRPLPPQSSVYTNFTTCAMCPKQDSNLHVSQHSHLKRARLPFRHLGLIVCNSPVTRARFRYYFERKTRLELATLTLARLCSTN